jgi:hypothetical protein
MVEPFSDEQKKLIFDALVEICSWRIHRHETRRDCFTVGEPVSFVEAGYIDAWWTAAHAIGEGLLGYDYCKWHGLQEEIEQKAKVQR